MKQSFHDAKLVFVGDGPFRNQLQRIIGEFGVTADVELRGSLFGEGSAARI